MLMALACRMRFQTGEGAGKNNRMSMAAIRHRVRGSAFTNDACSFCRDIKRAEPASFGSPATAIRIGNPRTGSLERQYWLVVNVSRIRHLSSRRGWSVMPRFDPKRR